MADARALDGFEAFVRDLFAEATLDRIVVDGRIHRFPLHRHDTKRSGWYALHHGRLGIHGIVGSWRTGDRWRYQSWRDADHDRDELARARAEHRRFCREREREADARSPTVAERAQRLIARSPRTRTFPGHAWASRKRLATPLWRGPRGTVLVPLHDEHGTIRSVQLIGSDGDRRFLAGSKVRGLRFVLGALDGATTIVVCEGISTGDAIHRSTGYPTVCAMSCGNLLEVARSLRRTHSTARIVIAADHDQLEDGRNPGLEAATRAARAVRGVVAHPPEPRTDWWDVWDRGGPEAVRALFDAALGASRDRTPRRRTTAASGSPTMAQPRQDPTPHDEATPRDETGLSVDSGEAGVAFRIDRFGRVRRDADNVARFIRDALADRLFYDTFTRRFLLDGSCDDVLERVAGELYAACPDVSWSATTVAEGLDYGRANGHVTLVDSLRAALDAVPPITDDTDWFTAAAQEGLALEPDYDPDLAAEILRTWWVGIVARILDPGHKVDTALVLQGPQGIGKSLLLRTIALEPHWFTDAISLHKLDEKDSLMELAGKHIIELPELAGLRKAEFNTVKKWMTQTSDDYRPPYGRSIVTCPRRFVIAATTNESEYLRDTENRRFLIIRLRRIHLDWFVAHRNNLYAQARELFATGTEPVLQPEIAARLRDEHELAHESDPWEAAIARALDGRSQISPDELLDIIGVPLDRRTHGDRIRVGRIMARMPDWHSTRVRIGGLLRYTYRRRTP